jgi:hypothetical protein
MSASERSERAATLSADVPIPTGVKVAIAAVLTLLFAPFLVFFVVVALAGLTGGGAVLAMRHTAVASRQDVAKSAAWALARAAEEAKVEAPCGSEAEARAMLGQDGELPECLTALGVPTWDTRLRLWIEIADGQRVVRAIADYDGDGQTLEVAVRGGGSPELVRED